MVNPQTPLDESLDSYAQTGLREQKRDWLQVGRRKINSERKARNGGTALPSSSKWRSGQRKIQRALASRSYLERTSVVLPRGPTALRVGLSAAELPTYFCRTPPVIHGSYVLTIGPEKKKNVGGGVQCIRFPPIFPRIMDCAAGNDYVLTVIQLFFSESRRSAAPVG